MLELRMPVKRFNIGDVVKVVNSSSHHNGRIGVIVQSNYSIKWLNKEKSDKTDRSNFMSCHLDFSDKDFESGSYPIMADNLELFFNGWYKSKENLPKEDGKYLCCCQDGEIYIGIFKKGKWVVGGEFWRELPLPPREGE